MCIKGEDYCVVWLYMCAGNYMLLFFLMKLINLIRHIITVAGMKDVCIKGLYLINFFYLFSYFYTCLVSCVTAWIIVDFFVGI